MYGVTTRKNIMRDSRTTCLSVMLMAAALEVFFEVALMFACFIDDLNGNVYIELRIIDMRDAFSMSVEALRVVVFEIVDDLLLMLKSSSCVGVSPLAILANAAPLSNSTVQAPDS